MKAVISLGCTLLITVVTTSVLAQEINIQADEPQSCAFTGSLVGTVPPTPFVNHTVGNLGFSCNYVGAVSIGMETDDGTVLKVPGEPGSDILYQIRWLVPPNMPWNSSGTHAVFGPWLGNTQGAPNEVRSEAVQVRFFDPFVVAGTYTDTVIFTISP